MNNENMDTELLISLVRSNYPYLYNKQDKSYKDVIKKENAWKSISETLNVEVDICKKYFEALKQKYTRERKKLKNTPSGSGAYEMSKWPWYNDLNFLSEYIQERRATTSNLQSRQLVQSPTIFNQTEEESQEMFDEWGNNSTDYLFTQEIAYSPGHSDNEDISSNQFLSMVSPVQPKKKLKFDTPKGNTPVSPFVKPKNSVKIQDPSMEVSNAIDAKLIGLLSDHTNNKESAFGNLVAAELCKIKNEKKIRSIKRKIMALLYNDDDDE